MSTFITSILVFLKHSYKYVMTYPKLFAVSALVLIVSGFFYQSNEIDSTPLKNSSTWNEPHERDSDGDGLPDIAELGWFNTDPTDNDTDGDDLPDGFELRYGLNPHVADDEDDDPDEDGLSHEDELDLGTHPLIADSDGDGIIDGEEVDRDSDPLKAQDGTITNTTSTDWFMPVAVASVIDSDHDGLSDWSEVVVHNTDPGHADSDNDLLFDGFEVKAGMRPNLPDNPLDDEDQDGLTNLEEMRLGSMPHVADSLHTGGSDLDLLVLTADDTDGDGLSNNQEHQAKTNPAVRDTDGDGLPDSFEVLHGLNGLEKNSLRADPDGDGVNNLSELLNGLNPMSSDSNADGTSDLMEMNRNLIPMLKPMAPDRDGDGLSDRMETERYGTRPDVADSDNDLLPDGFEVAGGLNPLSFDEISADPDADGVDNRRELIHRTNPGNPDSDGDGTNDGTELDQGSDPGDDSDEGKPPPPGKMVSIILEVGDHSSSYSERYNLIVGGIRHQAPEFGVMAAETYQFERGRDYPISIVHTGSKLGSPDFDYTARIRASKPGEIIELSDTDGILGSHDESSYFYAMGKSATLHIPASSDDAAPQPELAASEEKPETPPEESAGLIRFLLAEDNLAATKVVAINTPFFIEVEFEDDDTAPESVKLRWGFSGETSVSLHDVEGEDNIVRSHRITLLNPNAEVDATMPPPAPINSSGIAGHYRVQHEDEELGEVAGAGVIVGSPMNATLELRHYGRSYILSSVSLQEDQEQENLSIKMRGELPQPHRSPSGFAGGALGEPEGRIIEVPFIIDSLMAKVGQTEASVRVDGSYSHLIYIDLKVDNDELSGSWQKRTRDGEVISEGEQTWERAEPAIEGIIVIQDQTSTDILGPVYPYPFGNAEARGSSKRRTLVIYGRNLPQNRRDPLEITAVGEHLNYRVKATITSSDAQDKQLFDRAWEKLPDNEERGPDAILVEAKLLEGVLPGNQALNLNGMTAFWTLEFGDSVADINFVRATSGTEYETTDTVMTREHVRLQIETVGALPFDDVELKLAKNGEQVDLGNALKATRIGNSGSKLYLTPPILLYTEGDRQHSSPPQSGELPLVVEADDRLLAVPVQPDRLRITQPAIVEVMNTPADIGTLWKDALKRAAACHDDVEVDNWRTVGREKIESISNVIVFALEYRSTPIRLREQAAMILLRDTFHEMLSDVRKEFDGIRDSDANIKKFQHFMKQHKQNDALPFNNVEIEFPDGSPGKFSYLYYPEVIEPHKRGMSEGDLQEWAFKQTEAALDSFIATIDTALERAKDTGDCEVEELLDITGVGFDRVIDRLLPRMMTLKEEDGQRLYWVPDKLARANIRGIQGLANEVRAQQDMADIDNTMIALSLAAVSVGAGAILGEGILGLVVTLSIDAADIAFTLATEVPDFIDSRKELEFTTGAQMVVSAERFEAAKRNEKSWLGLASSVLGSSMGGAFSAYRVASQATRIAAVGRGAKLFENIAANGINNLSDAEKLDFQMFMINAKARQGADVSALSDIERSALKWVDDVPRNAANSTVAKVLDGEASPELVKKLHNAEDRRVIEQTSEQLGNSTFKQNQIERMLDAHHYGKPPYSKADLRNKMRLLTAKPPKGAGLAKDDASMLMRRGIMGNEQPRPMSLLDAEDRQWYNQIKNRIDLNIEDRRKLARLWRESEFKFRNMPANTTRLEMSSLEKSIEAEIIAGRLTPDDYNDLVHRFDNILYEMYHNGTGPTSRRMNKLRRLATKELELLGVSPDVKRLMRSRMIAGSGESSGKVLSPELFRGQSPDSFKPRELGMSRTPDGIHEKFSGKTYLDPKGKIGTERKLVEGDMEIDHIYPVDLIQQLPGFWRLKPAGRKAILHLESNLQPFPAKLNTQKSNKLAHEWANSHNISSRYRTLLERKQSELEDRMQYLIRCMLLGSTPVQCLARGTKVRAL